MAQQTYAFAGSGREQAEEERLGLLEQRLDPGTWQQLQAVAPGWRCLEVGAGRGSVAGWLADRVGPHGEVVACDIDTRLLDRLDRPNLRVLQHDILDDLPERLGLGRFDLVHARYLVLHLRDRQLDAIRAMARCLKPGGLLVVEDMDLDTQRAAAPDHPGSALFDQTLAAGCERYRREKVMDVACGRSLPALFERAGLEVVQHDVRGRVERGGSVAAQLHSRSLQPIIDRLTTAPMAAEERQRVLQAFAFTRGLYADPTFRFLDHLQHSCHGRLA
jgi:SAM-dependent methyltransferase